MMHTEIAKSVAEKVTGKSTASAEKIMGAEDFSYMLNADKRSIYINRKW